MCIPYVIWGVMCLSQGHREKTESYRDCAFGCCSSCNAIVHKSMITNEALLSIINLLHYHSWLFFLCMNKKPPYIKKKNTSGCEGGLY